MDASFNKVNPLPLPLPTYLATCTHTQHPPAALVRPAQHQEREQGKEEDKGGATRDLQGHGMGEVRVAWGYISRVVALGVVGGVILWQRLVVQQGSAPAFTAHNNPAAFAEDTATRYRTYWHYYSLNLHLLLWPYPLCCDWSMGAVPLVVSWHDPRNAMSALVLVLLVVWMYATWCACQGRWGWLGSRVVGVSGSMMIAAFLPAANLVFPVGFVVAERVLYLPSLGGALLVGGLLPHLLQGRCGRSGVLVGIVLALSRRTYDRNRDWLTSERLFASGIAALPTNAKLHYNLAHVTCKGVAEALGMP